MATHCKLPGKVYLVGAGPGSPKLLTLRAAEVLRAADVVFHDDLVSDDVFTMIPAHVAIYSVGKRCGPKKTSQNEINRRIVAAAQNGQTVVRLKGGDPLIFGRTQEEITALRGASIDFEIVPGITAATAAAAAAQIPLTERQGASKLVFIANHCCAGKSKRDWHKSVAEDATLVFYMPGSELGTLRRELETSGLSEETPCLLISHIARPEQKIIRTNIRNLSSLLAQPAPSLLIVGVTVTNARADETFPPNDAVDFGSDWIGEEVSLDLSDEHQVVTRLS